MARSYRVIDADGHVLEPIDLWDRYMDPKYRDRAPRLFVDHDGKERLRVEDQVIGGPKGLGHLGAIGARHGGIPEHMRYVEGRLGGFDLPLSQPLADAAADPAIWPAAVPLISPAWASSWREGLRVLARRQDLWLAAHHHFGGRRDAPESSPGRQYPWSLSALAARCQCGPNPWCPTGMLPHHPPLVGPSSNDAR